MENRHDELSAGELLAKLKANMEEENASPADEPSGARKTYHFRRSAKSAPVVTEESIRREMSEEGGAEPEIPHAEAEELDYQALMKKYLPEEDFLRMTTGEPSGEEEEEGHLGA